MPVGTRTHSPSDTSCELDPENRDLVLRIHGSSRDGQIVRVKSAKCTIGSGPRCTLRLGARGVRPLHCLIVRGSVQTVIRRWGPDTRLNGRTFSDAKLVWGDRLGIGPIEFEVLDPRDKPDRPSPTPGSRSSEQSASLRSQQRVVKGLGEANRQNRRRIRRLIEALRTAWEERRQWETTRTEAESKLAEQTRQLEADLADLEARRQVFLEERRQGGAERAGTDVPSIGPSDQSEVDLAELEHHRQTLKEEQEQWEAARVEAEKKLVQRAEELDNQLAELEAKRNALRRQRNDWEAVREEAEAQLAARAEKIDAREAELDARPAARDEPQQTEETPEESLDDEATTPEEASGWFQFQELSDEEPTNSEEIFRSMGSIAAPAGREVWEDKRGRAYESFEGHSSESPSPPAAVEEDGQTIHDYMAGLLERVRGTTGGGQSDTSSAASKSELGGPSASPAAAEPGGPPPKKSQSRPNEKKRQPVQMLPRAVAPEKSEDLMAMRELANLSAQAAIDSHARKRMLRTMTSKRLVTVVALVIGAGLLWIWWSKASSDAALYAALVSLVVALFWGIQYAVLTGYLIISQSGHLDVKPREIGRKGS